MGVEYLSDRLAPLHMSNIRTIANQPAEAGLGREFYETVLRPAQHPLASRFEALMEDGLLRRADPWTVAMHWKGLNEGEVFEKQLLRAVEQPSGEEIKHLATAGAEAFLRAYAPEGAR